MSASKTLRFFANGRRLSTAVRVKEGYTLQVYPMHIRFADEDDWRSYWENRHESKPVLRVEGGMAKEATKTQRSTDPSFRCSECLLGPEFDHRNCIVLKFKGNVEEWANAGTTRSKSLMKAQQANESWTCCICSLPAGNDHRMCIVNGFRGSNTPVKDWEIASGIRPREEPEPLAVGKPIGGGWTFKAISTATLPAGEYYIGDLCYALDDTIYENVFGANDYDSGLYTQTSTNRSFFVDNTAYGDGAFEGSDGKEYCVDAGIIGICNKSLMSQDGEGGHIHDFKDPVKCVFRGGIFTFKSGKTFLRIDTAGEEDE